MITIRQRLTGLGATMVLLGLVVGAPLILLGIGARPWETSLSELRVLLFSPDDGHLALFVMTVVAWCGWALTTLSFALEVVSRLRGIHAPRLPGLAVPQDVLGRLVAAAALLFTIAPVPTPLAAHAVPFSLSPHAEIPGPSTTLTPVDSVGSDQADSSASGSPADHARARRPAATTPGPGPARESATIAYTVRRGDSLWRIAEQRLGDGTRFTELVALNEGVLNGRANFIAPGLVLRLPVEATPTKDASSTAAQSTHIVGPGDTLWDIAEEHLGDPERYPEIVQSSRATVQRDGRQIEDPDLILPGWRLTIPTRPDRTDDPVPEHDPEPRATEKLRAVPNLNLPRPVPSAPVPEGTDRVEEPAIPDLETDREAEGSALAPWILPGLVGSGSLLAGGVLLAVRAHRRTQQRHRRPGFTIAPPPPALRNVEKTVTVTAGPAGDALEKLNRLLLHLSATAETIPTLTAVELGRTTVRLHLAAPMAPATPWTGTDLVWSCELDAEVPDALDDIPPYPFLTSVGQAPDGNLWLLDLEAPRLVALGGDLDRARALARHLAAELVLNPWGTLNQVHTIDVAPELTPVSEWRFHHHTEGDLDFLRWLTRAGDCEGEPELFHALLLPADTSFAPVTDFIEFVQKHPHRTGCAVVTMGPVPEPAASALRLDLTADGHLRVPHLDLILTAAGLSPAEAAACAALVDVTHQTRQGSIPRDEDATGRRALADQAGALREELVEPRPKTGEAGEQSLLPAPAQEYEAVADTTLEDIEELAPVVPVQVRRRVEDADPDLDRDVADWFDADCPVPRLMLMGTVDLRAPADRQRPLERRPFYCEIMAYLALHHPGVRGPVMGAAFGLTPKRLRTDLSVLREWLGTSPRSGALHLPQATDIEQHRAQGTSGYVLHDVLVDFDLFARLRARGQARGSEGMRDLRTALSLVKGTPFSALRRDGWQWLLDEERTHDTALQAVVDVAHLVTIDALARGDLDLARTTCELACRVAPDHDSCTLDLARVLEAQGDDETARDLLNRRIHNRTDDELGPIDLPRRTALLSQRRAQR